MEWLKLTIIELFFILFGKYDLVPVMDMSRLVDTGQNIFLVFKYKLLTLAWGLPETGNRNNYIV